MKIRTIKQFFSIFLIGSDQFSIHLIGHIRFIQFLLIFFYLKLLIKKKLIVKNELIFLLLFLFTASISLFYSNNVTKGIANIIWIAYNYFVIFLIFKYLSMKYYNTIFRLLVYSFRLQIIIATLLYLLGLQHRAYLFYYEPSYFAIALIPYISIVYYKFKTKEKKYLYFDVVLILMALVITKSALLLLILLLIIFIYLINNISLKSMITFLLFTVIISILTIINKDYFLLYINNNLLLNTFYHIISSNSIQDLVTFLIERGGNRIPRVHLAWDIFLSHPIFGVGIGNYENYTNLIDTSAYLFGNPWDEPIYGKPAVNIFLELLSSVGIVGFMSFVLFISYLLRKVKFRYLDTIQKSYMLAFFLTIIVLMFESNYLRLYVWMIMGLLAGSFEHKGQLKYDSNRL